MPRQLSPMGLLKKKKKATVTKYTVKSVSEVGHVEVVHLDCGTGGCWSVRGEEETPPEDVPASLSRGDSMSSCLRCQSVSALVRAAKAKPGLSVSRYLLPVLTWMVPGWQNGA